MVLRYKILTACVILLFAFVWLNRIEFFPLSANGMYANAVGGGGINYFDLRDSKGAVVDDNVEFYVAPTTSGNAAFQSGCFGGTTQQCRDYFRLVAQWIQQPITIERLYWNYKTGVRRVEETLTISP